MNANEVIANLAGEGAHANDHVNMGQSSNDVFPSAVHLAALDRTVNELLPALDQLAASLQAKSDEFEDVVKSGRTHLMDAVPVTLGQEFGGYAAQVREGSRRVRNTLVGLGQIPLGGTAVGNGLNTHPEFAARVRARLAAGHRPRDPAARRSVRGPGQPRRPGRGIGCAQVGRRLAHEDRQRPAVDGLGPSRRHRRDLPARAAEGLVDHARQGQPGHPRGGLPGLGPGDRKRHGHHRRRPPGQLRAERADPADRPQPARVDPPAHVRRHALCHSLHRRHRGKRRRRRALGRGARWPSPPPSTHSSATTAPRPSSRTPRPRAGRSARSPASTAWRSRCSIRRSICGRSRRETSK